MDALGYLRPFGGVRHAAGETLGLVELLEEQLPQVRRLFGAQTEFLLDFGGHARGLFPQCGLLRSGAGQKQNRCR